MITLTSEQARQIEEALKSVHGLSGINMAKPLEIIRAARAQEQAEQEPVEDKRVSMWKLRYLEAVSDRSKLIEENNALRAASVQQAEQEPSKQFHEWAIAEHEKLKQACQEFTAEQQDRFATAFDEVFAKAGLPQKQADQEPVAIKQLPDPYDARDGVWFDAEGLQRLRELPAGTKLYATLPEPVKQEPVGEVDIHMDFLRINWKDGRHPPKGTKLYTAPVEPVKQEPKDIVLPVDVTIGCGTIKAGCSLQTLLKRIEVINQTWQPKPLAEPVKQEPVCKTCEALARTVMMDQTGKA